jgi:type III restriction enzyme
LTGSLYALRNNFDTEVLSETNAEVMMSFRRSVDATTIAQLVGRMIRAPLARRIESDEALNIVDLFLPHYDTENLESVLSALRNPEAHEGVPSNVTTKAVE